MFLTEKEIYKDMLESSVDFPREGLATDVWDKKDGQYKLRQDVKDTINVLIDEYPELNLRDYLDGVRIIGSIGTNLYTDDVDVDVHLQPNDKFMALDSPDEWKRKIKRWSIGKDIKIGDHPLELYVQLNPQQDLMSDGVYDMDSDTWVKGPTMYPDDYNPYVVFANVIDKVKELSGEFDLDIGELKRDVIDYTRVKKTLEYLTPNGRSKLHQYLTLKVKEIENDIQKLMKDKKVLADLRKRNSQASPDEILKDPAIEKKWRESNALFKFIDRYGYLRLATELELMMKDDKVTEPEIDQTRMLLGMED